MTRQRYSARESLNRILRLFQGKDIPTDEPDTVTGDVLSEDGSLSDLAELFAGSLPNETALLPSSISIDGRDVSFNTLKVGNSPNYTYIGSDGTFRLTGSASTFDDLRIDGLSARIGVVAPTDETGFRGDSNFYARNFVNNQADEIQFQVQLPHDWLVGSTLSPHVHFSPWITGTADVQAAQFVLEYYWSNINDTFPASPSQYTMSLTWTGSSQWKHMIAEHLTDDLDASGYRMSSILKCRLYRDNTVDNNLAGKVTFLYFDIHYERDGLGSHQEYVK